ncbi:MAG: hypothetical protein KIT11_03745 [Fimbriimonadaceae bacterium]|nr:hypothetical protein [Fimbriimonadaceae bacterium]QYK56989.1 MAG: hypothetical protein KF733_05780 [Fimbriimonadaceae bacterium]
MHREEPLDKAAEKILGAILSGEAETVQQYLIEEERSTLSVQNVDRILKEVILPRVLEAGDREPVQVRQNAGQGVAEVIFRSPARIRTRLSVETFRIDGKPRFSLTQRVRQVWWNDYVRRTGEPYSQYSMATGYLEGLRRDASTLSAVGLTTFYRFEPREGEIAVDPVSSLKDRATQIVARGKPTLTR